MTVKLARVSTGRIGMAGVRIFILLAAAYVLWACSANARSFDWSESDAQTLSEAVLSGQYGRITSLWIEQI